MEMLVRTLLVAILTAGMLNLPVSAAERPLAVVVASSSGYLEKSQAISGVDIYSGEGLSTDNNGSLRVRIGSSQLALLSLSSAALTRSGANTSAHLSAGSLSFSVTSADPVTIDTDVATILARNGSAYGQVTITSPTTITVSAFRGSLMVNGASGDEQAINEGQTYNIRFVPDPEPGGSASPTPAPPVAYHHGHGALIFTIAVVAAAGVISGALYHHYATESSSNLP